MVLGEMNVEGRERSYIYRADRSRDWRGLAWIHFRHTQTDTVMEWFWHMSIACKDIVVRNDMG